MESEEQMKESEVRTLMATDEDFHVYVLKHCRTTGDSIEKALRNAIVKNYAEYLVAKKKGRI